VKLSMVVGHVSRGAQVHDDRDDGVPDDPLLL
jgi:hypothetical protein